MRNQCNLQRFPRYILTYLHNSALRNQQRNKAGHSERVSYYDFNLLHASKFVLSYIHGRAPRPQYLLLRSAKTFILISDTSKTFLTTAVASQFAYCYWVESSTPEFGYPTIRISIVTSTSWKWHEVLQITCSRVWKRRTFSDLLILCCVLVVWAAFNRFLCVLIKSRLTIIPQKPSSLEFGLCREMTTKYSLKRRSQEMERILILYPFTFETSAPRSCEKTGRWVAWRASNPWAAKVYPRWGSDVILIQIVLRCNSTDKPKRIV